MTTAFNHPDDPLPGPGLPNASYVWTDTPPVMLPGRSWAWRDSVGPPPHLIKNPILESPMYFPGLAWKGTAGMPGRYGEVVYA
jgi:hypothetical protein